MFMPLKVHSSKHLSLENIRFSCESFLNGPLLSCFLVWTGASVSNLEEMKQTACLM